MVSSIIFIFWETDSQLTESVQCREFRTFTWLFIESLFLWSVLSEGDPCWWGMLRCWLVTLLCEGNWRSCKSSQLWESGQVGLQLKGTFDSVGRRQKNKVKNFCSFCARNKLESDWISRNLKLLQNKLYFVLSKSFTLYILWPFKGQKLKGAKFENIYFSHYSHSTIIRHIVGDTDKKLIVCLYSMDLHSPALSLSLAVSLMPDEKNLFNTSAIKLHNHAEIDSKNVNSVFFGYSKNKGKIGKKIFHTFFELLT